MDAIYEPEEDSKVLAERVSRGFSRNYRGNIHNPNNQPQPDLGDENCSVFIRNLPASLTVKGLLDAIMEIGPFGKVWHVAMMAPDERHLLASARVNMRDRKGAEALLSAIEQGKLVICGLRAGAIWDRLGRGPKDERAWYLSRCLVISGPPHLVDPHKIHEYIRDKILFQTQRVSIMRESDHEREIRWWFGGCYAQSQAVKLALNARWPTALRVRFGEDPIEVGEFYGPRPLYDVDPGPDPQRLRRKENPEYVGEFGWEDEVGLY